MSATVAITGQFLPLYRRIGELDPSEHDVAELLVAHEEALRDFAASRAGGPHLVLPRSGPRPPTHGLSPRSASTRDDPATVTGDGTTDGHGRRVRATATADKHVDMTDFARFDRRHYETLPVRSGYAAWASTYDDTVDDVMDMELLNRLESIRWPAVTQGGGPRLRQRAARPGGCARRGNSRSTAST